MAQNNWTRDQLLVAFNLYCRIPFGRMHSRNPEIIELAGLMGRTPSAVAMKLCNFASLDPAEQARAIHGLKGASKLDRAIWDEFHSDWELLAYESEQAKERLAQTKRIPKQTNSNYHRDRQKLFARLACVSCKGSFARRCWPATKLAALFADSLIDSC